MTMTKDNGTKEKTYLALSDTDRKILESYRTMIPNLGEYLGEGYEIILHSLENLQHSVIANVNGHYSGRANGAPITDFALSMLARLEHDKNHSSFCYMNHSKTGVPLRSSTIPIMGENQRIIGLICINFYTNISISQLISKFQIPESSAQPEPGEIRENFAGNTDELIENVLGETKQRILNDSSISSQNKNKRIVEELYAKGIFNIKDAVIKVAGLLGISKNTVYMHIRNANTDK